jgi:Tfp pilus assembly protein PilF
LISENHLPEATELLKLNVQLNPGSASAYDSLGEAYTKSGQKELAIESYRKSLEKNPDNTNARDKLKQLQSGEAAKN